MIKSFFILRNFRDKLNVMKGYKKNLKKYSALLIDLKNDLSDIDLVSKKNDLKISFLKQVNFNIVLKQYVYEKFLQNLSFNFFFLKSLSKNSSISFYIHPYWFCHIEKKYKLNKFISLTYFCIFLFSRIAKALNFVFKNIFFKKKIMIKNKICVMNFNETKPLEKKLNYSEFSIFNWIAKTFSANEDEIFNNDSENNIFQIDLGFKKNCFFLVYSFFITIKALIMLFFKNYNYLLLLEEIIISKKIDMITKNELPKKFIFIFYDTVYRPLWTYIAERRGISIELINYAGSFPSIQKKNLPYPVELDFIKILSWPNMHLFSQNLLEYYQKFNRNIKFIIHKFIYFIDSDKAFNLPDGKTIAFFDVYPARNYYRSLLCSLDDFANQKNSILIFKDLINICENLNINIVYKPKRNISSIHSKAYKKFIQSIQNNKRVIFLNPEISPFRIIQKVSAVISRPFTTTSLIAKKLNVNSAYYDPIDYIDPNDPGRQGIELIKKKNELYLWLNKVCK